MVGDNNVLTLLKTELSGQLGSNGIEVFNKLDVRDWGAFFRIGERRNFDHNAVIMREGQSGESVHFLAEGEVRVVQKKNDVSIELARLSSGSIFGEMSFLDGAEVSASVIADGYVELIRVTNVDLKALIEEDSRFAHHFYQSLAITLSRRLRATNKIITTVN